jgi:hypothetical protein
MSKQKETDASSLSIWQKQVIITIDGHEELRDSDQYQGVAEFNINRSLGVSIAMPRGSGHTYLSNFIASKYPSVLVYDTMKHFQQLTSRFPLHTNTDTISKYEIFYGLNKPDVRQPSPEFMAMRERFLNKKVIVVDNALSVSDDIKNFIYSVSNGIVVLLGH